MLPDDLIDASHAARIVGTHLATIHRWVTEGAVRGWKRRGSRKGERKRLYVSRSEIAGLFEAVEPKGEPKLAGRKPTKRPSWVDAELRAAGLK